MEGVHKFRPKRYHVVVIQHSPADRVHLSPVRADTFLSTRCTNPPTATAWPSSSSYNCNQKSASETDPHPSSKLKPTKTHSSLCSPPQTDHPPQPPPPKPSAQPSRTAHPPSSASRSKSSKSCAPQSNRSASSRAAEMQARSNSSRPRG
jgi:hypothetical protein